ncbi:MULTISPECIES: Card1-like endonuclease domain-containing protein [unclassified Microcoleus]|uniref:Card1-like endonuclease domain-containing protein n=1 Tax=unclassified Microcoleus TaxID=2642155 RepID=UPI002FD241BF
MSSNDTFQDYKVKHLFLLVGENPLPNYVATMKLLDTGGTVYLVYTNQTLSQKALLMTALKTQGFKNKEVELKDNKSNAYRIYDKVHQEAKKISNTNPNEEPEKKLIGLHYTGGTNTMAVHAYRAIDALNRNDTVYSYLDAKTLEIFIDNPSSDSTHRGVHLTVPLEVLFKLHKYEWHEYKKPLTKPILPDAAAEFVRLYQDEVIAKTWRTWANTHQYKNWGELNKAKNLETGQWKSEDELSNLSLSLTGVHPEIIEVLRHNLDASPTQLSLNVTKAKGFESFQQVCGWLGGIWLEHYVLQQVKELTQDLQLGESKMSIHIRKYQSEGGKFEFDVAFMRSYQLFAISCTTSAEHTLCKLKLFEAYIRAKQLGGDEARVALVCCCDGNKYINQQSMYRYLKSQLEGSINNPNVAVFVRQDLLNLKEKIADWVDRTKGKS